MERILNLTASEIGRQIAEKKICPVALTEAFIERINSYPQSNFVFTTIMQEKALAEAEEVKIRLRQDLIYSRLDGVPISWKDLFDTEKIKTEAGTELLKNRMPKKTAAIIETARKAGLISIAKTHMTELAFSGLGVNPVTKTPPNSIKSNLAPGGSSSGAAVSVALGLVPCSIGSDTGGSVRVPASWNNLVGFKPTHGQLSLEGVVPLCPKFDTIGPIVKSVEDAANLFSILQAKEYINFSNFEFHNKKIAVIQTSLLDDLDDKIQVSFDESLKILGKSGVTITFIKSAIISDTLDLAAAVYSPEAYGTWKHIIEKKPHLMYPAILERFRSGAKIDGPAYVRAWQKLNELRKNYLTLTADFDVTLTPTTPILPPNTNKLLRNKTYFSKQNLLALRNTRLANLLGLPALSLPTRNNFCGLMVMGKPFKDHLLLSIGKIIEEKLKK